MLRFVSDTEEKKAMTTSTNAEALINRSTIDQIIQCNAHAGRASWVLNTRPKALAEMMLRDEGQQPAQIPFVGFYESSISDAFEYGLSYALSYYKYDADDCELTAAELDDCAQDCAISAVDAAEIARAWTARYEDYLSDAANDLADEGDQQDDIRLNFAAYNTKANRLGFWPWGDEVRPIAHISKADLRRLRKLAAQAPAGYHEDIGEIVDFAEYVRKRFTPCSGWAPFYSADIRDWGSLASWSAAQVGVLLDFICPACRLTEYDLDDRINEVIANIADAAFSDQIKARKAA